VQIVQVEVEVEVRGKEVLPQATRQEYSLPTI
jgi:hypothetical protein